MAAGGVGCVLHFLSSVHSQFLYPPTPLVAQAPFRMMGFLLMLLVDLRGAEPQALPLIALPLADCWRASGAGWGLWAERVEAD